MGQGVFRQGPQRRARCIAGLPGVVRRGPTGLRPKGRGAGRLLALILVGLAPASAAADGFIWPTPNPAFQQGRAIESFVQPTASGNPSSGLFGCVRNGGARFHEGLDLFPIERDARGEALDPIYAVLPGRVVYVNAVAGNSSYGRYVVVEHEDELLPFHTLYAHLASIGRGIRPGVRVEAGSILGVMGRSASYRIPRSRAHLHFEMGLRLTDSFQDWFDRQRFGSENRHGVWNGMNLVSVDPLRFYEDLRMGRVSSFLGHLQQLPVVARIRVFSDRTPDFVQNFPALVTGPLGQRPVVAWDIAFTKYGLPKEWTPRFAEEGLRGRPGDVRIVAYNPSMLTGQSCRRVLDMAGGQPTLSAGTLSTLKKLFDFR